MPCFLYNFTGATDLDFPKSQNNTPGPRFSSLFTNECISQSNDIKPPKRVKHKQSNELSLSLCRFRLHPYWILPLILSIDCLARERVESLADVWVGICTIRTV